jgi:hypothetical protein
MIEWVVEIEGYEGYFISTLGNVYSKRLGGGYIDYNLPLRKLKARYNRDGYNTCNLEGKTLTIHRLVGKTFISNPENKPYIDHINRIKNDNRVENLRWATTSENCRNISIAVNNKSGIKGVSYNTKKQFWQADWTDNKGKAKSKSFSISKYGYDKAKRLAILARKEAEKLYYKINIE